MSFVGGDAQSGVSKTISELVDRALNFGISKSTNIAEFLSSKYQVGFKEYVRFSIIELDRVKTLATGSTPVSLRKTFEEAGFDGHEDISNIEELIIKLNLGENRVIITAMLGSGKSHTMKRIHNCIGEGKFEIGIPVFVELRSVDFNGPSLEGYIFDKLSPFNVFSSLSGVEFLLKHGSIILLLDGFDEVNNNQKKIAEEKIVSIGKKYPKLKIIVSSRKENSRFISWTDFNEISIRPLSIDRLSSLINKLPYDEIQKQLFLRKVSEELFKTHQEILSNPLLASMMLITFEEFQEIPSKMHRFYGVAFDVMFRKHDKTKFGYTRDLLTKLDLEDFKRVFMTFCFFSYLDKRHSFENNEHENYFEQAIKYEDVKASPKDFSEDAISSVCVLVKEGDTVEFIHRSFQEYFCSLFLARRSIPEAEFFIDEIIHNFSDSSECVGMLIEIDMEEFERKYLEDKLRSVIHAMGSAIEWKERINLLCKTYVAIKPLPDTEGYPWHLAFFDFYVPSKANNKTVNSLAEKIRFHYNVPFYSSFIYAKKGWIDKIPKKFKSEEDISHIMIDSEDFTKSLYAALNIDKYYSDLENALRFALEGVVARKGNRSELLSRKISRKADG